MNHNIIVEKTYIFAIHVINICKNLMINKEYILSKQLLRCWTSIWANVQEAVWWYSKKDFMSKIAISYKEARETRYWINLLFDTGYIERWVKQSLSIEIDEIIKSLGKIYSTTRKNIMS